MADNRDYRDSRDIRIDDHDMANRHYDCECCYCKKIFMMLVLLILVFIAGIMVGNCGRCRYADYSTYGQSMMQANRNAKTGKLQRGMHQVPNGAVNAAYPAGGFIVEVDQ